MKVKKLTLHQGAYPSVLRTISSPPKELYYIGADSSEWLSRPRVAIVGSRAVSSYVRQVTERLSRELAQHGVVIISGLALGVDAIAHSACLDGGGITVAVLANGLDKFLPATNAHIARRILGQGETIFSEYPEGTPSLEQNCYSPQPHRGRAFQSLAHHRSQRTERHAAHRQIRPGTG